VLEAAREHLDRMSVERVVSWSEKNDLYRRFGFPPVPEAAFRVRAPEPSPVETRTLEPHTLYFTGADPDLEGRAALPIQIVAACGPEPEQR